METIVNNLADTFGVSRETIFTSLLGVLPDLLGILAILLGSLLFYFAISRILTRALAKTKLRPALIEVLVSSLFKWSVFIIAFIMILSQIGIDVTAAVAGVGIVGIAIGFAAKETLSNILSGFSIFIDDLYRRGDWVEVAGKYGQVKQISLRTTKIRNLDNIFIIIPNSEVTLNPVTNYSEEGMVRFSISISIGYKESVQKAREILLAAVQSLEGVLHNPAPEVVVDELADSGVNLKVRIWVDDAGKDQKYKFLLTETCKQALDAAEIEIPYPQRDVHMK